MPPPRPPVHPTRSSDQPQGETRPNLGGEPAPRLPHEHDESASSQQGPDQPVVQQAARDVRKGLPDTDRGPVLEELRGRIFPEPTPKE